ncbi:hemerythrin domain-containing protein [Streptomyces sp. NPDC004393]|uniref:hemerythrin domain-containing protein n=1 Tax=unclassified Streptomyces TaxID=2593676 RepID=UPI0033A87B67
MASHDGDRVVALSLQLSQAHQELRRQINEIRTDLGRQRSSDETLLPHCLAFCSALTAHHRGEDDGMFTQLLRERPDLAATVANLREDHRMIASVLARVRELADMAAESRGRVQEAIARELEGLAAIMESHFRYEERAISEALDGGIPDTGWSPQVFRFDTT